ncbi:GNAT family N-acetyltransferase [Kineococcus rubinsiae]|uniref:GNAT family N-acetyltransferase n=1 Tax=Kineococcus rubinsiae TaxID=2609562 RepID=UPI0014300A21|nr:GNAT family N-acetyltransferase [Kineococcus rubinsiae]NIZ91323.1 GNAT family N-acetyltransferase [Kineococcus rubinsiae]
MSDALADLPLPPPTSLPPVALPVGRGARPGRTPLPLPRDLPGLSVVRDPAAGLQVSVRHTLDGAPVPEWRVLAVAAGAPPFCGPDWLLAVHEHLGAGEPLLVLVRRQGRLLALGAFAALAGPRPLLTFLGAGGSDYATVLTDPDCGVPQERLVAAVLDAVVDAVPGALLDLEQVRVGDVLLEAVDAWAAAREYSVRRLQQAVVASLRLPDTLAEHEASLGRHARHEERRQWRRLAATGTVDVVDDLLADREVGAVVGELAAVDRAHPHAELRRQPWAGESGRLLEQVLSTAPRAVVQLTGIRVDGVLVAYTLCFAGPRALHGYLQSYRAEHAAYGPGALLLLRVRRRAIASGYRELDLLRGEEDYKRRLTTRTRRTVRLVLAPAAQGLVPGLVDRLSLLRRTYRDELRRHERLVRRASAAADAGRRVAQVAASRAALLRLPRRRR